MADQLKTPDTHHEALPPSQDANVERRLSATGMRESMDRVLENYGDHVTLPTRAPSQPGMDGYISERPEITLWAPGDRSKHITIHFGAQPEGATDTWGAAKITGPGSIESRSGDALSLTHSGYWVEQTYGHDSHRRPRVSEVEHVASVLENGTPEKPRLTLKSAAKIMGQAAVRFMRRTDKLLSSGDVDTHPDNDLAGAPYSADLPRPEKRIQPQTAERQRTVEKPPRIKFWRGLTNAVITDLRNGGFRRDK